MIFSSTVQHHCRKAFCMKKIIALLTVCCLAAGLLAFPCSAAGKSLVVLGDSIAAGYGLNNPDYSYAQIVADKNGYSLLNKAVSGDDTADMLALLNGNDGVISAVKGADIVEISIGGNDFQPLISKVNELSSELAVGNFSSIANILVTAKSNLQKSLARIRELNPDADIIIQTLYNPDFSGTREAARLGVQMLNNVFSDCLKEQPGLFTICDVYTAFGEDASLIAADRVHPAVAGHARIAETLLKTLDLIKTGASSSDAIASQESSAVAAVADTSSTAASRSQMSTASAADISADESAAAADADGSAPLGVLPFILGAILLLAATSVTAAVIIARRKPAAEAKPDTATPSDGGDQLRLSADFTLPEEKPTTVDRTIPDGKNPASKPKK